MRVSSLLTGSLRAHARVLCIQCVVWVMLMTTVCCWRRRSRRCGMISSIPTHPFPLLFLPSSVLMRQLLVKGRLLFLLVHKGLWSAMFVLWGISDRPVISTRRSFCDVRRTERVRLLRFSLSLSPPPPLLSHSLSVLCNIDFPTWWKPSLLSYSAYWCRSVVGRTLSNPDLPFCGKTNSLACRSTFLDCSRSFR